MSKEQEVELWRKWKQSKSSMDLQNLLRSLDPLITSYANKLTGNLPASAIKAKMIQLTVQHLDNYDQSKSQINTYLGNTAYKKLHRYVYEHQNIGTIPENRVTKIGLYNRVHSNLTEQYGRPPTIPELSDELRWSQKQVKLLQREMRQDLIQEQNYVNVFDDGRSDIDDNMHLLYEELFGVDKLVLAHTYGLDGKEQLDNSGIARKLNISPSMVTQIKSKLAERLKRSGALAGY